MCVDAQIQQKSVTTAHRWKNCGPKWSREMCTVLLVKNWRHRNSKSSLPFFSGVHGQSFGICVCQVPRYFGRQAQDFGRRFAPWPRLRTRTHRRATNISGHPTKRLADVVLAATLLTRDRGTDRQGHLDLGKRSFTTSCPQKSVHNSFFFFLILHPFRHRFGAACQAGILSAASRAQMADVEQMKKIVPFVTCDIIFGQNVCELTCGINVSNLTFGIKINPVEQLVQSNSVGS